ncbi:NUDIX hydrolase [Lachnospiraceae bacterium OttesenSCG-928-E19]|nr:NUDIX hydrolase [Lachnospiraceae bacterium OttesenSCG-928-E19]
MSNNIKIFVEYGLDFDNNKYGFGKSIEIEYADGTEIRTGGRVKIEKSDKIHARYFRIWIGKFMMVIDTDKPHVSFRKKKRWNFKIVYGTSRHVEIKEWKYAAYILPMREVDGQKQVAMAVYKSGWHGLIGGRLDEGETPHDAMCREVCEELGENTKFLTCNAIQIPDTNKIQIRDVLFRRAKKEEHTYFVARVPDDTKLVFCEKGNPGFEVRWINVESLGDEKIIVMEDMRQYFIENVIPFIKSDVF